MRLHPDIRDFLAALDAASAKYLVVGGYAVGFHAKPRHTKDLDIYIGIDPENTGRVERALRTYGAPESVIQNLLNAAPTDIIWFGVPPSRIDVLLTLPGAGSFQNCYANRKTVTWDGITVQLMAVDDLIRVKEAAGRPQDIADVKALRRYLPKL